MSVTEAAVGGVNVSRETIADLQAFGDLVRRWTPAINLVGKATVADLWNRHIVDSAQIFALRPPEARTWVDLGSGGGFPGLVVAVLARELTPALRVTLVEADLRKATFLRQAAQLLGLQVDVRSQRIETLPGLGADVLSARALAPLAVLIGHADRLLAKDGIAIFPKGARSAEELASARRTWDFEVDMRPSLSEGEATILVIRNIHRARHD